MTITTSSLRAHLLQSLSTLPNRHDLGLTILVSKPKKTASIFPHTPIPPKCLQQDFLIVLSSDLPSNANIKPRDQGSTDAPSSSTSTNLPEQDESPKKVSVSAISANLYTFPSSSSRASSILYVSKVDSSGYSPSVLPLTRLLIVSFFNFFLLNVQNVRIQLFARSQNQYLFANSSQGGGKKVLSGAGLCKWWKNVYEESVISYISSISKDPNQKREREGGEIKLNYLLPGYEEVESLNLLGKGKDLPEGLKWEYKPPFDDPITSTGNANTNNTTNLRNLPISLATLIPSLPDDPKTRFLEELVTDTFQQNPNPLKSRQQTQQKEGASSSSSASTSTSTKKSKKEIELEEELNQRQSSHIALSKIDKNEFWERIGFRQECAGDVTGFFTLETTGEDNINGVVGSKTGTSKVETKEDTNEQHSTTGFSIPPTVTDVVDPITSLDPESEKVSVDQPKDIPISSNSTSNSALPFKSTDRPEPVSKEPLLRIEIINRLLTALTNLDFANLTLAIEGSEIWLKQVNSIVKGEIGEKSSEGCSGVIPRKMNLPDSGEGAGAGLVRKERQEEKVTMLMPRKKKKI
ncbi:hypothetical protein L486_05375 [Kwoniella mangroviensis CBS 10435]|uniref:histone acetyltransferase n=1 Tax=Kwoniella mangroviensis CBS 10435 TaxID=1331196 RepID=A0A1B9ILR9_9TREE|nr:hypothetical protein L486_05375 [Kwoniella mangroviensis CBS 10435]OCF75096.1 hypothetical protein I204_03945 [Kwoniella mangroviensis CBS 8886]